MSDCDKGTGNCPAEYKNIGSENFGNKRKVTTDLLYQFCKNDSYLYQQILELWDKTDPETRKRFYPPYYMDIAKSYGVIEVNKNELTSDEDRLKLGNLDSAYHLSDITTEIYHLDFDESNDRIDIRRNTANIYDDSLLLESSDLTVISEETNNGNINHSILPHTQQKKFSTKLSYKVKTTSKTTKKVTTKTDQFGKLTLDAKCSGPYKDWNNNSVWYIGYNRNKNYNVKNKWKKNPDDTSIPSVCRAQTFKAEHTGELRKVVFKMKGDKNSVSPCIVELRTVTGKNKKPSSKVLARTEQKFNHSSVGMVNFTFKKPAKVTKGTTYALVIRSPLSNFNKCYWIAGWASTCFSNSRKRAYYDGETFLSEDNGKTWIVHGKKEKCYGSHYYDWGFAEAPVNFGFEVYIAPKTGTKTTTEYIPSTKPSSKTNYFTPSITVNYYSKNTYYLEFKPFLGNFYESIQCDYTLDEQSNCNIGEYTWQIFDVTSNTWMDFDSYTNMTDNNHVVNGIRRSNRIDFNKFHTFVKVRLKLEIDDNIVSDYTGYQSDFKNILTDFANTTHLSGDNAKITSWVNKVNSNFKWCQVSGSNNLKAPEIRQIKDITFTLTKSPSYNGYCRTLYYHPDQEGMLPACIWSEINVDAEVKNNGVVKVDIIHERDAIERITLVKVNNKEVLRPFILYYESEIKGRNVSNISYNTNNAIQNYIINTDGTVKDQEFIDFLRNQAIPIYILPFKNLDNEYVYYFAGDSNLELLLPDYPAYPLNSVSIGTDDIHIDYSDLTPLDNSKAVFTYDKSLEPMNNIDVVKGVHIIYNYDDPEDESITETNMVSLVEGDDYTIDGNQIIFNVTGTYEDSSENYILSNFLNVGNTVQIIENSSVINTEDTQLVVELVGYDYNEFQHFMMDYGNKSLTFYNPTSLPEGELKIHYNPLWCRDLDITDFPLKMDLWKEYYKVRKMDNSIFLDKQKMNKCGELSTVEKSSIENIIYTKVPPRDNIRKVTVNEFSNDNFELIEDVDFTVDYLNNKITLNDKISTLSDGDEIIVRYTPNLTDNGLALGYRLYRDINNSEGREQSYSDVNLLMDSDFTVNSSSINGDDVFLLGNYFTTRT